MKITVIATGFDENRQRLYGAPKKPVIIASPVQNTTTTPMTDEKISDLLGGKELPAGVDISDSFDIPSFLKKNN